jgi:hypothetical protein
MLATTGECQQQQEHQTQKEAINSDVWQVNFRCITELLEFLKSLWGL